MVKEVIQTIGAVLGIVASISVLLWVLMTLPESRDTDITVIACLIIALIAGVTACLFGKVSDVIRTVISAVLCVVAIASPFILMGLVLAVFTFPKPAAILLLGFLLLFAARSTGKKRVHGIIGTLIVFALLMIFEWTIIDTRPAPIPPEIVEEQREEKIKHIRIAAEQGGEDAINLLRKIEEIEEK